MSFAFLIAILLGAIFAAVVGAWIHGRRRPKWLPRHLYAATELKREQGVSANINGDEIVGRMDRHWRLPDGTIVVAEFKTRARQQVYDGDQLQLSIAAAILRRRGRRVHQSGGVIICAQGRIQWHDVTLLSDDGTILAIDRYKALLHGRARANPQNRKKCAQCGHQAACAKELGTCA